MTSFVFKSLMIAGAFLFFGGHLPLTDGRAGALPGFACEADPVTCRLGTSAFRRGQRAVLLAPCGQRSPRLPAPARQPSGPAFRRGIARPDAHAALSAPM